jgi:RNA polymerase sigma factor (sigma-70 family)
MQSQQLQPVIQHLRSAAAAADRAGLSDAELLGRYASGHEESAFELLVWRHAGLVLGVCHRVLRHEQDALDAFQATFLALAKRARAIGRRESVGGWLYKVAYRVALRAHARAAGRAAREQPLGEQSPVSQAADPCTEAGLRELRQVLDEQVNRLPEKYRAVLVLRCLAGKSSAEAARDLRCPVGTVESRLARARARLRAALVRRGYAVPAALLTSGLSGNAASAGIPPALVSSTLRAALLFAAGQTAATGAASAQAITLAKGVLRAMFLTKLKCGAVVLLVAGVLGFAGSSALQTQAADDGPRQSQATARDRRTKLPPGDADRPADNAPEVLQAQVEALSWLDKDRRAATTQLIRLERARQDLLERVAPGEFRDRELARLQREAEPLKKQLRPAPRDGVITEVLPHGEVTIGLPRRESAPQGTVMHVYRLEPRPEYLGRVEIIQVNGATVKADVVSQIGLMRPGDFVARSLSRGQAPQPGPGAGKAQVTGEAKPLWAGLSINQPVFTEGDINLLQLTFTLVNDGDKVIDPKITTSAKIVVNGKPLPDSAFIFGNGPRDARFTALPPGDYLLFGSGLGSRFKKPGVYRVHWEGDGFRSPEIVFRVLPKKGAGTVQKRSVLTPDEVVETDRRGLPRAFTVELRVKDGGFPTGAGPRPLLLHWDGTLKGGGHFTVVVTDKALAQLQHPRANGGTLVALFRGKTVRVTGYIQSAESTSSGPADYLLPVSYYLVVREPDRIDVLK